MNTDAWRSYDWLSHRWLALGVTADFGYTYGYPKKGAYDQTTCVLFLIIWAKKVFWGECFCSLCIWSIHSIWKKQYQSCFCIPILRHTLYTLVMVISIFHRINYEIRESRRYFKCWSRLNQVDYLLICGTPFIKYHTRLNGWILTLLLLKRWHSKRAVVHVILRLLIS